MNKELKLNNEKLNKINGGQRYTLADIVERCYCPECNRITEVQSGVQLDKTSPFGEKVKCTPRTCKECCDITYWYIVYSPNYAGGYSGGVLNYCDYIEENYYFDEKGRSGKYDFK